jgi:hypothetical protein
MKPNYIVIFVICFLSFGLKPVDQNQLFKNYLTAIENESTIQYFLVITATETKTGKSREVCTQGNFLHGAIHREFNLSYKAQDIVKVNEILRENEPRKFEFGNDSALWNLGISDYTIAELKNLESKVDFSQLAKRILTTGEWTKEFQNDDKLMKLYAHALFNQGILTGENNCFGGTLMFINEKEKK